MSGLTDQIAVIAGAIAAREDRSAERLEVLEVVPALEFSCGLREENLIKDPAWHPFVRWAGVENIMYPAYVDRHPPFP